MTEFAQALISYLGPDHEDNVKAIMDATLYMDDSDIYLSEAVPASEAASRRITTLVDEQYEFVWRSLRRLGVRDGDCDDAAQQVFLVATRKLDSIRSGCERSFLYQTALRVASDYRRSAKRRFESCLNDMTEIHGDFDHDPSTDEMLDMRRARRMLDAILDQLPLDLRAVFVLHELEQSTMADIAGLLNLPAGTVASRLRRARLQFTELLDRVQDGRRPLTGAAS